MSEPAHESETGFALGLYGALTQGAGTDGNLFFSPLCIASALEMAYLGARGATAREMEAVLRLPAMEESAPVGFAGSLTRLAGEARGDCELVSANRLWGQTGYDFDARVIEAIRERLGADVAEIDFAQQDRAAQAINAWVADRTHDRITKLVSASQLSPLTRLVLTNAIFFKGLWRTPFDPLRTKSQLFWLDEVRNVEVPLMEMDLSDVKPDLAKFGYASRDGWQIVELPYRGGSLVMDLIKPADDIDTFQSYVLRLGGRCPPRLRLTLSKLEAGLTPSLLQTAIASLRPSRVIVKLPRLVLEQQLELSAHLIALGMRKAFTSGEADFTGLTPKEGSFLGEVIHGSYLRIDEAGTEAAAATGGSVTGSGDMPPIFRADHPFLLLIREALSGTILFMGRVADPSRRC